VSVSVFVSPELELFLAVNWVCEPTQMIDSPFLRPADRDLDEDILAWPGVLELHVLIDK
jgi:hypothetical protein